MNRNLLFLMLFFTGIAIASPVINTPTDYITCADFNSNGIATFDLTTKNVEILGANNPALYTVDYFEVLADANSNINRIVTPENFINTIATNQTVYVRVTEIADISNFGITNLNLIVNSKPIVYNPGNLAIQDLPFDGFATFDLTTKTAGIINGQASCTVTYFENYNDALNNNNPIATPIAYTNTTINQQGIGFRITNSLTGCYNVGGLVLFTVNEPIITFTDPAVKQMLLESNPGNTYPIASDINLQTISIDANGDSEIEQSEAEAVRILNLTYHDPNNMGYHGTIQNLNGLGAFTNLIWLICAQQSLNNVDTVQLSGLSNLQVLNVSFNNLSSLDVTPLTNLSALYCASNHLSTLNVTGLSHLTQLYCYGNTLSSLDFGGLSAIADIDCSGNQISSLNVAPLTTLTSLNCGYNSISSLDVAPLTSLQALSCGNNSLSTIDIGGLTQLTTLSIPNNPITVLPIDTLVNLTTFDCTNDLMTTVDVSTLINLNQLFCGGPNLTSLFMKNGKNETLSIPNTTVNLQFICADEVQVASIQTLASTNASPATVVSSYCTFTPGGNYNKVTGTVRFDSDNNGCDSNDTIIPDNVRLNFTDGNVTSATFLNTIANYTLFGDIGNYTLTPSLENPAYFNISPASVPVVYAALDNTITNQDFCLTANGIHNDVEIVVMPVASARPGFDAVYKIIYKNKGNQTLSGDINFTYNDTILDYVSSTTIPNTQSTGLLTWNYSNLLPFESRAITLTLNVNSSGEIPPVNLNDILNYTATVATTAADENQSDNTFTYHQIVVGSYDPNDITCIEGDSILPSEIGNYLHYAVNFENTGTADAENIVVKDIIDIDKYDINSLQVINTSDQAYVRITGNVVEFIFENINLAAAHGSPPVGGHGDVLFKIKTKGTLSTNDTVIQRAGIYFDYNFPVVTNDAETTFAELSNPIFEQDNTVKIYPNPTHSIIIIESNFDIDSVELYDIQGRILETHFENASTSTFDISNKSNGIYFLRIKTEKGSKVEKIVKE